VEAVGDGGSDGRELLSSCYVKLTTEIPSAGAPSPASVKSLGPSGADQEGYGWCRQRQAIANMASYSISSSLILVIHDNMINGTNHIV
jgi:hypothetical protein